MEPENNRFGGGVTHTVLHPLVAVAIVVVACLLLVLPRKYAAIPLLLAAFFIPIGQVLVLGGVHLPTLRLLILIGCAKLTWARFSSGETVFTGGVNSIDRAAIAYALLLFAMFSLIYMDPRALLRASGSLVDALGGYVLVRYFIQDRDDVIRMIKLLLLVAAVMSVGMIHEKLSRQNVFWMVGGGTRLDGSSMSVSDVRDYQVRAQGPFVIYLLAGAFGSTLLPLALWLWTDGKSKIVALVGAVASVVMTVTVASSTSVMSFAAGIVGLCFWPLRRQMRQIRWSIVILLITLHLAMKAPVWHLISRIDLTGSSSSYHRYLLVDNFIRHFGDWWLIGVKDYNTWGFGMWDTCNAFVSAGLQGGLITFIAFIAIICCSFSLLGDARKAVNGNRKEEWFLWCLGAALFAHTVGFWGVVYDLQMQMAWFILLVIISITTYELRQTASVKVEPIPATRMIRKPNIANPGFSRGR